ncbi:MAG TPA: hypothetical protein VE058_03175 [Steroidobacteraceae bacterium]|nr:hypothetical protein [Steroidobacteraceae bacterium]
MKLALLLALIMPLQGFASAWGCGSFDTAPAAEATAAQHCAHDTAHDTGVAQQHHHCGTCCHAAAIAVMPLFRVPPRPAIPGALLPVRSPPAIVLDRLDRPPRLV